MKAYPLFFHDKLSLKSESFSKRKGVSIVEKQLIVTTCLLLDENKNVLSVGLSFQNLKDPYNRKEGNKFAKVRAIASLNAKKNLLPIKRERIMNLSSVDFLKNNNSLYKALFNPDRSILVKFFSLIEKKKFNEKEAIEV